MVNDNIEQIEKATIDFANQIKTKINSEEKTETLLKTDQKVLARITDGIYRHAYSFTKNYLIPTGIFFYRIQTVAQIP